eukprot:jgi/Pico_ML_1/52506/g3203.t1
MRSGACIAQAKHKSARNAKSNAASTSRGRVAPKANGAWKNRHVRCRSQAGQEEQLKFVNLPGEIGATRRCMHGSTSKPLFRDDAACVLAEGSSENVDPSTALGEAVVTRFVDDLVSRAISEQDIHQIVLVGTGMDTRPYRLPWGMGTMFFEVGPAECLRTAEEKLKEAGIRPPKGVLHRRVPAGLQWADGSWYGSLAKVGYRGDRPSIWVVSGLSDLNLNDESYDAVLENVSNGIMLDSFVVGELPVAVDGTNPVDSLASWDMLAMSTRFEDAIAEYGLDCSPEESSSCAPRGFLIRGKQTKLSRHQHRVYTTYTNQLESDADEDYFDNIV